MKRKFLPMVILFWMILCSAVLVLAASDIPKSKQTVLGLYLTAEEAFSKWHVDSEKVVVLDVRTPEEYIFVGHAPMARNIPVRFLNQELTAKKRDLLWSPILILFLRSEGTTKLAIRFLSCAVQEGAAL